MSASDSLKQSMHDIDSVIPISDDLIRKVLDALGADLDPKKVQIVRNLIEFAIRMYLVRSSSFNTTRAQQVLDALGLEALRHTRAD
jgi:hypothetical protein